jgi:hypothetical protein
VKELSEEEKEIQLRVRLEGEMVRRFLALKKKLGFESNSDLVRLLITRSYEEMVKAD